MKKILVFLLRLYQRTLSPDHGLLRACYPYGFCRFYPSCSEYAVQTLTARPFFKALPAIAWRLVRCNPMTRPTLEITNYKSQNTNNSKILSLRDISRREIISKF